MVNAMYTLPRFNFLVKKYRNIPLKYAKGNEGGDFIEISASLGDASFIF